MNETTNMEKAPVFDIRRCAKFKPEEHLYPREADESGITRWDIKAADRVLWYHLYCEEHGIKPFIDDSEVHYFPACGLIIGTATVYMDGEPVGKASASFPFDPATKAYEYAAATVGTYARSRALSNAGFGPLASGNHLESGEIINPDMGIVIPDEATCVAPFEPERKAPVAETEDPAVPEVTDKEPTLFDLTPPAIEPAVIPAIIAEERICQTAPAAPVETAPVEETVEEAAPAVEETAPVTEADPKEELKRCMCVEIPLGKFKGRTLGDINANMEGRRFIQWLLSKGGILDKFPEFAAACEKVNSYNIDNFMI